MIKQAMAVALLAVGMWAGATCASWAHEDPDAELKEKYARQVQVNDSTTVLLAKERAEKRQLEGLVTAARQLNGKLVAAAKVRLRVDSAVGTVKATPLSEGERQWRVYDSTATGILSGTLTVPAHPAPPVLGYVYRVAPVVPSIGFVKLDGGYVIAVTCSVCDSVQVDAPFLDEEAVAPEARLTKLIGWQYDVFSGDQTGRLGAQFRLFRAVHADVEVRRLLRPLQPREATQALVGVAIRF